jgi:hypothetical protein
MLHCGSSMGFGIEGILGTKLITLVDLALNHCPVFERNHVK